MEVFLEEDTVKSGRKRRDYRSGSPVSWAMTQRLPAGFAKQCYEPTVKI